MKFKNPLKIICDPKTLSDKELKKSSENTPVFITMIYLIGLGFFVFGAYDSLVKSKYEILMHGSLDLKFFTGIFLLLCARQTELTYEFLKRNSPNAINLNAKEMSLFSRSLIRWIVILFFICYFIKLLVLEFSG